MTLTPSTVPDRPVIGTIAVDSRWAVGVFILATLIATAFTQLRLVPDHVGEEQVVAVHVARGHGFRTPLDSSPTAELTAWVPPGYPLVAGGVFRAFGVGSRASLRVLCEINSVLYGAMVAGVFVIGCQVLTRPAGLVGAALVVLNPTYLLLVHRVWDTYFAQAILVWLTVLALAAGRQPTWRRLVVLGAGLGALVQFNGSFLLVAPVLVGMAVWQTAVRRWVPLAAAAGLAFAVVLGPWTARNWVQFHKLLYVRRGAELEMWLGNRPGSSGWQVLDVHPAVYEPERRLMLSMGEANYFALCGRRFQAEYDADPAAYWRRTARRCLLLVVGEPNSRPMEFRSAGAWAARARMAGDVLLFSLGIVGLAAACRAGHRVLWTVPLSVASVVPYVASHVNYRFSIQVKLFLSLLIGYLLWAAWRRVREGAWPTSLEQVGQRGQVPFLRRQ